MKQYTPIKLDKIRNLRYGFAAIAKIEDRLDIGIAEINLNKIRLSQLATIVWAGLEHEDKNLSPEWVLETIDAYDLSLEEIGKAVGNSLTEAFQSEGKKK
ncbi:gene transfer agent family protein [bacterium]|nr:MAG: gene transfer agent family protein [bacterium]